MAVWLARWPCRAASWRWTPCCLCCFCLRRAVCPGRAWSGLGLGQAPVSLLPTAGGCPALPHGGEAAGARGRGLLSHPSVSSVHVLRCLMEDVMPRAHRVGQIRDSPGVSPYSGSSADRHGLPYTSVLDMGGTESPPCPPSCSAPSQVGPPPPIGTDDSGGGMVLAVLATQQARDRQLFCRRGQTCLSVMARGQGSEGGARGQPGAG